MGITAGTFGYSLFIEFSSSSTGNLFVPDSDASISDELLASAPVAAPGVGILAVALTFAVLVGVWRPDT